jgi:hypothetical protein
MSSDFVVMAEEREVSELNTRQLQVDVRAALTAQRHIAKANADLKMVRGRGGGGEEKRRRGDSAWMGGEGRGGEGSHG